MDLSQYSDEELEAMAAGGELSQYSDQELEAMIDEPDTFGERAAGFAAGAADMATMGFADEIGAGVASPFLAMQGIENPYNVGLEKIRGKQQALKEDTPLSYGAGQFAGGVGSAATLAPKAVTKGLSYAASKGFIPALAASGTVGGISGGVYGYGSGEGSASQRLQSAKNAAPMGAAGGVLGSGAGSLASRALKLFSKKAPSAVAKTADDIISPERALQRQSGELLDISQGAATQNPALQSIEKAALKGGMGDAAQNIALRAQSAEQAQIRGIVGDMAADSGDNVLQDAAKAVRGSYGAIKAKVNKAYDDARIINKVYISQAPIDEVFKPQVKAILKDGGFDITDFTPRSKKLVEQVQKSGFYNGKKVTSQNLEKLEFWRRKATNAANDAYTSGNKSEGAALKRIIDSYDNFMAKLPEDALMSGDEEAIKAINNARYLRRKQGVLFERNKVVKNLVQNKDLTGEELANMVLTGSKASEKINKGAGGVIKNMRKAIPEEKQPEFINNIKRGTMARILKKSQGTTLIDGDFIIQPNKLIKELDGVLNNKTFVNEIFDEAEQKTLNALKRDLIKINSVQAGSDNYSNTAYALMRGFQSLPFGGAGASAFTTPIFKAAGDQKGKVEAMRSFSPILKDLVNDLSGKAKFYGAATGGAFAGSKAVNVTPAPQEQRHPDIIDTENYESTPYGFQQKQ